MIIMLKILRSWKMNKVGLDEKEKFQKKDKINSGISVGSWMEARTTLVNSKYYSLVLKNNYPICYLTNWIFF